MDRCACCGGAFGPSPRGTHVSRSPDPDVLLVRLRRRAGRARVLRVRREGAGAGHVVRGRMYPPSSASAGAARSRGRRAGGPRRRARRRHAQQRSRRSRRGRRERAQWSYKGRMAAIDYTDGRRMRLDVEFHFAAAHRLPRYEGPCFRLHGHNYRFFVALEGEVDPRTGMIADFGEVKRIVQEQVLARVDHRDLNDVLENPTAENIALDLGGARAARARARRGPALRDPGLVRHVPGRAAVRRRLRARAERRPDAGAAAEAVARFLDALGLPPEVAAREIAGHAAPGGGGLARGPRGRLRARSRRDPRRRDPSAGAISWP